VRVLNLLVDPGIFRPGMGDDIHSDLSCR
jgi:hypothetical protein